MHVQDWRALSNDSVVDVTPGVERWHTLWFMWESPRCPEHLIFTTKTLTIVHCFITTTSRDGSTFWIYFIWSIIRTHDALQCIWQWSVQAKTPWTHRAFCLFWNHVKWLHKSSALCVNGARPFPPSPNIPDFPTDVPAALFWNFCLSGESLCMGFVKHMRNAHGSSKGGSGQLEQGRQFSGIMREEFYPASPFQ